jgi:DNA polymerase III subunit delta'
MQFSEILGLDDLKATLIKAVKQNHLAHAQLFLGKEGAANLPLALAYATYLNCENPTETDSCGKCSSCYRIKKLIHPDLHFVFPTANVKPPSQKGKGKNNDDDETGSAKRYLSDDFLTEWRSFLSANPYGSLGDWSKSFGLADNKQCNIPVDEGRKIISKLMLSSFDVGYKIMILWLPELMNSSAANAILKILEEPPAKTIFLLVSNSIDQMLPTILSRTQIVAVRQFYDEEIETYLKQKFPTITPHLLLETVLVADGNLAEAVRMIEKGTGNQQTYLEKWLRACYTIHKDFALIQTLADEFSGMNKEEQKTLFLYGLGIFRQCLVVKYGSEDLVRLPTETLNFVRNFSKAAIHEYNIQQLSNLLSDALMHIERNASPKIMFTDLSFQMARLFRA